LGKIHQASKKYKHGEIKRRQWNENDHIVKGYDLFKQYLGLQEIFKNFIKSIQILPKSKDEFGLIHGDFLFSNYFFSKDDITVFDFDECEYSWYIYDIAVCMYYYLLGPNPDKLHKKESEAEYMFANIMKGYLQETDIDSFWIQKIDLFFSLRDFVLMSSVIERNGIDLHGWNEVFFREALDRRLKFRTFVDIDFMRIFKQVKDSV